MEREENTGSASCAEVGPALPKADLLVAEPLPFGVLAELQVIVDGIAWWMRVNKPPGVERLQEEVKRLVAERPEGWNRTTAIAYYETVTRERIGRYPMDPSDWRGGVGKWTELVKNLADVLTHLERHHPSRRESIERYWEAVEQLGMSAGVGQRLRIESREERNGWGR